jgi:hypothetical protein
VWAGNEARVPHSSTFETSGRKIYAEPITILSTQLISSLKLANGVGDSRTRRLIDHPEKTKPQKPQTLPVAGVHACRDRGNHSI